MPPNGAAVVGRANLQAFGESFPKVTQLSFSHVGVQVQGDLAVAWSRFQMSIVGDDGAEVNDTGKQLVALENKATGAGRRPGPCSIPISRFNRRWGRYAISSVNLGA